MHCLSKFQVVILLYICQYMVALMWTWRINPDNSAIPYLTALGDVLGTLLLFLLFLFLDGLRSHPLSWMSITDRSVFTLLIHILVFGGMVKLGDRVSIGGYGAIVRYIGDVTGHPGTWVGVEWDDPDRGKHNGTVNGIQYFETRFAKGGSLVNLQNVSPGVDLLSAILNRYADDVDENVYMLSTKPVELVGMQSTSKKQSNIFELKHIVLESCSVVEPPPDTCEPFRKCLSLNLFNNLLSRWEDIRKILKYFPKLRELVLSNIFELKHIVLESCSVVEPPPDTCEPFRKCLSLNLFNNLLSRWEDIRKILKYFPKLRELVLRKNRMEPAPTGEPWKEVNSLRDLVLSDCDLSSESWRSINRLQALPMLSILYIDCENLSCVPGIEIHEVIIAKLSGLVDLNRFDISAVERQSAEVRFLDKYFSADEDVKADHMHDLERLKKVHGTADVSSKSCGLNVVSLSICYGSNVVKKRVPLAITVQKLTEMIGRVFSTGLLNVKLVLDKVTMSSDDLDNPTPKQVYRHIIRCGIRLRAKNQTVCSGIMMMHRLLQRDIGSVVCNYTLATTCLVLAAKYEEDRDIGVRDVINASHRILHPDGDPAKLNDHMYELRRGISELTFVVLRELNFDLNFGHPFNLLAIYLDTLRSWMPKEFSEKPIVDSCNVMLRDCYSVPEFVLSHSSHSLVIAVISLVLKGIDVDVPHSRDWFEVLHKSMTEQRLQKVETEIIRYVYGMHVSID
ncbi:cyclin domain protein [Cooperia oncophora]